MKKIVILFSVILIFFSCEQEEHGSPLTSQPNSKVKKVLLREHLYNIATEICFNYSQSRVQSVQWHIFSEWPPDAYPHVWDRLFLEERSYLEDGNLGSVNVTGNTLCENDVCRAVDFSWNLSYEFRNGLRYKINSVRTTSITTVFTEYNNSKPVTVENLYGVYSPFDPSTVSFPQHTALKFDAQGNLIQQLDTEIPGFDGVVNEKSTTYTTELNPLRNLMELPFSQGVETYDDLAFYYSTHLPTSVEANYPYVNPKYNAITSFEYQRDNKGRIMQIKAINAAWSDPIRYTMDITYY